VWVWVWVWCVVCVVCEKRVVWVWLRDKDVEYTMLPRLSNFETTAGLACDTKLCQRDPTHKVAKFIL
jgi:hypothetical protein